MLVTEPGWGTFPQKKLFIQTCGIVCCIDQIPIRTWSGMLEQVSMVSNFSLIFPVKMAGTSKKEMNGKSVHEPSLSVMRDQRAFLFN
jgi:hypothetical protein